MSVIGCKGWTRWCSGSARERKTRERLTIWWRRRIKIASNKMRTKQRAVRVRTKKWHPLSNREPDWNPTSKTSWLSRRKSPNLCLQAYFSFQILSSRSELCSLHVTTSPSVVALSLVSRKKARIWTSCSEVAQQRNLYKNSCCKGLAGNDPLLYWPVIFRGDPDARCY